jgi:hypothetical protein
MFSGVIIDGWKNDGYENVALYTVNDTTLEEDDLFRSVDDYKLYKLSETRIDYFDKLHKVYADVDDRNQLLADFIMKSRMINGNIPDKLFITLSSEHIVTRIYVYDEREFVSRETVDKFYITKNDDGVYEFCFVECKYNLDIPVDETSNDTTLIVNDAMENYISKLNKTM